ncbi:MAG: hypothetical protein LBE79_11775 [Tannerella sp.]|jgi:hypothetical protein|nr:hypothetical protein [Tannerella sp.]
MAKIAVKDTEIYVIQINWEQIYNPDFNYGEFDIIMENAEYTNFKPLAFEGFRNEDFNGCGRQESFEIVC